MGFDQYTNQPVVQVRKRTTKVNIAMVVAVVVFFVICGAIAAWFWHHPEMARP